MELFPQADDLLAGEAQEGEHAAFPGDEGKIHRGAALRELVREGAPQAVEPLAHFTQLLQPLSGQFLVVQDATDDGGAMVGRHRIDSPAHLRQVGPGDCGLVRVS